jgi:hypothetical protein
MAQNPRVSHLRMRAAEQRLDPVGWIEHAPSAREILSTVRRFPDSLGWPNPCFRKPMLKPGWLLWLMAAVLIACSACSSDAETSPPGAALPGGTTEDAGSRADPSPLSPEQIARRVAERPWEVLSNKGEAYVPNVFYADAAENEQIMPYALDGHVMIDRLIYPTLGNPNLYSKADDTDELVVVLRVEESAYAELNAKAEPVEGSPLSRFVLPTDAHTGFGFFLIPRNAREAYTESTATISSGNGTDVVRIYPHEVLVNPEPSGMPEVLRKRKTLRFIFRRGAMTKVPAGLYDLRFELRKDDALIRPAPGASPLYEYQYNAVQVFDAEPDEYSVLNVTDTQISVGSQIDTWTRDKLDEFVHFVNTSPDPAVKGASFITFNGDLHNGGSPFSLTQQYVATTYADEAKTIVGLLKRLRLPIFLTTGNHDGYASIGHVPTAVSALDAPSGSSLRSIILGASPKAWPGFSIADYDAYIEKTAAADRLGGLHVDIVSGGFSRTPTLEEDGFNGWKEVPRAQRNMILYDGFYQWQKTYGPLYYSHNFGKNHYVSLNSYELRQHRRSGWGMYTVNYGGSVTDVQLDWLDRELLKARKDGSDVIVLAHHDPRGGHHGKDAGYYFEQMEFRSVYQSFFNYVTSEVWSKHVCKFPTWALSRDQEERCIHDGLQEWMRPDPEFDCTPSERGDDGTCFDGIVARPTGIDLLKRIAQSPEVRTLLLGHTHYNALEVLQEGDELLPGELPVDSASAQHFATLEVTNPLRGFSELQRLHSTDDYDAPSLSMDALVQRHTRFADAYATHLRGWPRTLSSPSGAQSPRELVVLRLVSNADLTSQTYSTSKSALGFSVLHLDRKDDVRRLPHPQINRATFFANAGQGKFEFVGAIGLNRLARLKPHDVNNPVELLFDLK